MSSPWGEEWSVVYSEVDRMRMRAWWDQLRPVHSAAATRSLVEMIIAKDKWGVRYSEEQERIIRRVLFARQKHQAQHGKKEETCMEEQAIHGGCT